MIVNDMAEVNIDAKLTRSSSFRLGNEVHRVAKKSMEMQNGCVCCTLRADLVEAITKLPLENRFNCCLLESTGISDPIHVAETFSHDDENSSPNLVDVVSLDTMVTVIDCKNSMSELQKADSLRESNLASSIKDDRTITKLLLSQVSYKNCRFIAI